MSRTGRLAQLDALIGGRKVRTKSGPGKPLVPLSELVRIMATPPPPPPWTGTAFLRAVYAATGVKYERSYGSTLLRRAKAFAAQKAAGA